MPDTALAAYRILDFGEVFAGPYATTLLADAGAEVIKIESVQRMPAIVRGDRFPSGPTFGYPDNEPGERPWERFFYYHCVERNKRGITLDLSRPEGRAVFMQLVCTVDAVVSNYAGGVLGRLGLDYAALSRVRPDIVLVHLPAFGSTGPYRDHVSFAPITEAMSGHMALRGYPETAPADTTHPLWGDAVAAVTAAFATLAALRYRARTGRGQFLDLSQAEASTLFTGSAVLDYSMNGRVAGPTGNREPDMAPCNTYPSAPDGEGPSADDRWVAIAVRNDAEWANLCAAMDRPELTQDARFRTLADRKRHEVALDAEVAVWTRQRTRFEAAERLRAAGIPASPVLEDADLMNEPQVRDRNIIQYLEHDAVGTQPYVTGAWQVLGIEPRVDRPPNLLGEHNAEVLRDLVGISAENYRGLEAAAMIGSEYLPSAGRG